MIRASKADKAREYYLSSGWLLEASVMPPFSKGTGAVVKTKVVYTDVFVVSGQETRVEHGTRRYFSIVEEPSCGVDTTFLVAVDTDCRHTILTALELRKA